MTRLSFLLLFFSIGAAAQAPAPQTPAGTPVPSPAPPPKPVVSDAPIALHGRVVAADTGVPLRGATVSLNGSGPATGEIRRTAVADRQGQYRFDDLLPGPYMISASRPGFVRMYAGQKQPAAWVNSSTLSPGETRLLDFRLHRGGLIAGRLTDQAGEPLAGIRLRAIRIAHSPNGERFSAENPMPFDNSSDDRGEFRVAGLSPGTYLVAAEHDSSEAGESLVTTYYPGTTNLNEAHRLRVSLSEQVRADFSMQSGRLVRIAGLVRSSEGKPLQNARVLLRSRSSIGMRGGRIEDSSGTFDFAGVAPGEYTLDVSRAGVSGIPDFYKQNEFASMKLSIGTDDVTGLLITTGPGITVTGRVIYERSSSDPITPAKVQVHLDMMDGPLGMRSPSADPKNGTIADDGAFTVTGGFGKMLFSVVQPGWRMKAVTLNGADITDVPYDSSRGNIKDLEIVMTDRQQLVLGTVVHANGKPASDYHVIVFPTHVREDAVPGRFIRFGVPQKDGMFRLVTLPPGDYLAAAFETIDPSSQFDPAFREAARDRATPFHLSTGETRRLELTMIE